jgi:MFS family permease
VTPGTAGQIFSIAFIAFILFSIPAGYIGSSFGRRRTILLGLAVFSIISVIAYLVPVLGVVIGVLALGGLSWSLININSLPMVVDSTNDDRLLGTYTGLYYLASQSAAIFGPILNGALIDVTGRNYNMIFLVTPVFFVLAIVAMLFVTRGEARTAEPAPAAVD